MYSNILNFLRQQTGYARETSNDIICRCPFCGDSIKHKNKGHLYISKEYGIFHCFRCSSAGSVIYLFQVLQYEGKSPFKRKLLPTNQFKRFSYKRKFVKLHEPLESDYEKVAYINNRVGHVDTFKYRIIWNLERFLLNNNITIQLDSRIYHQLNNNYVGFLSFCGNKLIFRAIDNKCSRRYFTLQLSEEYDYYVIKTFNFDTWPHIIVCEGVFDVISAISKLKLNGVYIASNVKFSLTCIKWLMMLMGFTKPDITIVLDVDARQYINKFSKIKHLVRKFQFVIPIDGKDINECKEYSIIRR